MAVADAPSARPPAPEECEHPTPVTGVLAHEFAHYEGAIGPEGKRRTVTYYGPVVGGLPIDAWHCEVCGLLRLSFPDGRREERRLFPGPQPGLLAVPVAIAPERELFGLQARVSGLSATPAYIERLVAASGEAAVAPLLPRIALPEWDVETWLTVLGLSSIALMLFVMGILAVYTYSTPSAITPLAIIVTLTFVALLLMRAGTAAVRHAFPVQPLRPSVAEELRQAPVMDAATRAAVTLFVVAIVGLFVTGILAVYSYSTPGAAWPVFLLSLAAAVVALLTLIGGAIARRLGPR